MDNAQIKEFCKEAFKVSETKGIQNGLSFLIGEKFSNTFLQLKKAQKKLQFLYPTEGASDSHPLNKGGRTLKMSYAMTIQEHYSIPLEQVKHYELFLKEFVVVRMVLEEFPRRQVLVKNTIIRKAISVIKYTLIYFLDSVCFQNRNNVQHTPTHLY